MKKIILLIPVLMLSVFAFCQNQDEEAIKKVVIAEVQGWLDGSEQLKNSWYLKPYSMLAVSSTVPENRWFWQTRGEDFASWLDEKRENREGAKLSQFNHQFRISGDLALVIFEQTIEVPGEAIHRSRELKILEKVEGAWKITVTSAHFYELR